MGTFLLTRLEPYQLFECRERKQTCVPASALRHWPIRGWMNVSLLATGMRIVGERASVCGHGKVCASALSWFWCSCARCRMWLGRCPSGSHLCEDGCDASCWSLTGFTPKAPVAMNMLFLWNSIMSRGVISPAVAVSVAFAKMGLKSAVGLSLATL